VSANRNLLDALAHLWFAVRRVKIGRMIPLAVAGGKK
jgi:hypothetical protein